jgi:hypothetical protein
LRKWSSDYFSSFNLYITNFWNINTSRIVCYQVISAQGLVYVCSVIFWKYKSLPWNNISISSPEYLYSDRVLPPENLVNMKYRHIQLMSVIVHRYISFSSIAISEHLGTEGCAICKLCVSLAISDQASFLNIVFWGKATSVSTCHAVTIFRCYNKTRPCLPILQFWHWLYSSPDMRL